MPTLKTPCPACGTTLRVTADDDGGEHELECPRCGHEFTAALDAEDEP
ncbi:MAG: hypothetical protein K2V38_07870, partial [Gemmataceae bacterium]|nr:hypothetical protein [Gemmataceae bacterium]